MTSPRLLAICRPVAHCLEQRDGAGLLGLLAPFADDPELDAAIAAVAAAFPHLRTRAVPATWPASREDRCVAVLSAAMARPRDDTALANAALRPTAWNWLTSLGDVVAGRDAAPLGDVHSALEAVDIDRAAALLRELSEPIARRGWQAVLVTAAMAGPGRPAAVEPALEAVRAQIAGGEPDVPAPVVAVVLAILAQRRRVPDDALQARVLALPPGLSRDLATAAALTAWSDAGPLAADALERIVVDPVGAEVVAQASGHGRVWLGLLRDLIGKHPAGGATLFDTEDALEPGHARTARETMALAEAAALARMPVTARMAAVLLRRVRRADLADRVQLSAPTETVHLAAMLVPSGVLPAIESPRSVRDRAVRRLGEADASKVGRPIGAPLADTSRLASDRVSICVINHNQAATTARLLASLARLWRDFEGEVLLFDNGSQADDLDHLAGAAASLWPGRVRLLRSEHNLGPGPARNLLFAEVRTEWILSLDNDMIVIADIGRHLLPAAAASGGSVFNLAYEELDHPGLAGVGKSWSIADDGAGGKVFQTGFAAWTTTDRPEPPTLVASNRLSGGASLFKTAVFKDAGGFAGDNAIGYEDYEFSLRLADRGVPIETLGTPLLVHGHMAPARASDLAAVTGRFNRTQMDHSTKAFSDVLAARFGAHLGERGTARPPHRIVPRRFDFRHADGHGFFATLRPGVKMIGLVLDAAMAQAPPALLAWLAAQAVNVEVRHESEFAEMEQALLVLQACDIIVGGPSMLSLSPERCRALGLVWTTADHCPEVIVLDMHEASADQVIAAIAPRL